ncbi:hypothetical protein JG688_00009904 [Phytophthora aleatoria]|uniref:Uncharacterized protein n=1 Tax=Phytophthora aleatoria TaxID=2496075 RepID=A0A8J5IQY3_9STRA|nr:hypothetical protein JG688_00009904 [Phytophthora aleatoria]
MPKFSWNGPNQLEFGRAEQALNHANKSAKLILETEHKVREYNVDAEQYPADAGKRKSDIAVALEKVLARQAMREREALTGPRLNAPCHWKTREAGWYRLVVLCMSVCK